MRRRKGWKVHFWPLQCKADFQPEIRITGFQIKHQINWKVDATSRAIQSKIHSKTKLFSRNAASKAINIRGMDFVCQGATVKLFAPYWLDDAKKCPVTNAPCGRGDRGIFMPAIHLLTSLVRGLWHVMETWHNVNPLCLCNPMSFERILVTQGAWRGYLWLFLNSGLSWMVKRTNNVFYFKERDKTWSQQGKKKLWTFCLAFYIPKGMVSLKLKYPNVEN